MKNNQNKSNGRGGKREGAGRKKGAPNKINAQIKEAILGAFEQAGGQAYLLAIAHDDPKTFCALLGKILPTEIANADGKPFKTESTWAILPVACASSDQGS